ncbi:type IV toxin-antitoxin system AbiEi family antitoxin domain-containing protein [Nocardioides luteus]|nr:type IV toxin-antitoxin system AbiEi family antitoxin domain-containing protein [Nocardioides luteus]
MTLARIGAIAERRWGLISTAQAANAGVSRKQVSRMATSGALERVTQGTTGGFRGFRGWRVLEEGSRQARPPGAPDRLR